MTYKSNPVNLENTRRPLPIHTWIGLVLIAVFWPLNWFLNGPRSHWAFFFLWVGYSLAVDGFVFKRTGSSLITRSWKKYLGLFLISAPAWWLFEVINWRIQNWIYLGTEYFSDLEYTLLSTLAFSTVIPAVFGTAELVMSVKYFKKPRGGLVLKPDKRTTTVMFILGWIMLGLMLALPKYFFPFIWLSVYFILEPINVWLGNTNLLQWTQHGDWRPILALWLGVLLTGFTWEFWNYWSFPKWVYDIPYFEFWHIFEMPLLGYLGYLPFSLELIAIYHLITGLMGGHRSNYVLVDAPSE